MNFKEQLKDYQRLIENELEQNIKKEDCLEKILNESMAYSLLAGGKRLRPILMLSVYKIFNENYNKYLPYAVAMEMIHNFSLIHDDLPGIDNDDFRHGKPTNHKKFNEATAILAGDALLNKAYKVISGDILKEQNETERLKKIMVFNEMTIATDRMIAGEYVDTEYEGKAISSDYLEYMHKNKTGAILRASARIGAILSEAPNEDLEKITKYAEIIGLTFQIKDDILSFEGEEKILGKPVGNDAEKGKCTYVTKYGINKAKEMLQELTKEAVNIAKTYNEKGEFIKELAIYIENRNK